MFYVLFHNLLEGRYPVETFCIGQDLYRPIQKDLPMSPIEDSDDYVRWS